jgi:hypothetical protein
MDTVKDVTIGLAVPGVPSASTSVDLGQIGDMLKELRWKTLAALIAGSALAFNVWFAGIFNSGHPIDEGNWKFFLLVLIQAVIVTYAVVLSMALAVDVAGGILGGTIIIIVGNVAGAFRGAFDVGQFVAQLVIAYFVVAGLTYAAAIVKARNARRVATVEPD